MSTQDPLIALHEAAGAEFQAYGHTPIVSTFGSPEAEYASIHRGCGLMDLAHRGVVEAWGEDRLEFLNRLLTNELWNKQTGRGPAPHQAVHCFLLNNKGRIIAEMNVADTGEKTLMEMDRRLLGEVRAALERYVFSERVELRESEARVLAVLGPGAAELVAEAGVAGMTTFADATTGEGVRLVGAGDAAVAAWKSLTQRYFGDPRSLEPKRRLRPVGWAAFNSCRIEAGRPLFGIDFDDSTLPAETGLIESAVSFTKGCYLGQEIVARMHARGQVSRLIVGIRMDEDALPVAGEKVFDERDNEVGGVTSSTISPVLSGASICLAMVKKSAATPGTKLRVPAEGAMRTGTVVPLPFYKR